ncbi:MAG: hypothetical protein ACP5T4_00460 [Candidatus Micrarchaeia archaeon]
MHRLNAFAIFLAILIIQSINAQNSQLKITPYSVFSSWLPIMYFGIILSFSIVTIYYLIGYLLNNKKIKSRAIAEFAQAVGTGIVIVILIAIFNMVGTTIMSPSSILSAATANSVCNSLTNSPIDWLNSNSISSPTFAVCNSLIKPLTNTNSGNAPNMTQSIDYGLAATYVIIANLTNQVSQNLNAFYVFDGIISFLRSFQSNNGFSFGVVEVDYSYKPLAGYAFLRFMTIALGILSALTFYSMTLQQLVILIMLVAWPYVLAAGVILRSTQYTRRLGGLLIGIVISLLLILPMIFLFEYASLTTPQSAYPIGSNTVPYLPIYEKAPDGNVLVYGGSSGFVPQSEAPNVKCNGEWVYEAECGNSSSAPSPPVCKPGSSLTFWQKCQNGYIQNNTVCPNTKSDYVYETVCGDPNTMEHVCLSTSQLSPEIPFCPSNPTPRGSGISPFILPNATRTLQYYSCWPPFSSVVAYELAFSLPYLIPLYGLITGILSTFGYALAGTVTAIPFTPVVFLGCNPYEAINATLALANIYGLTTITAFILPLLNILIVYSGAMGFSKLMGGDTDIMGISKLL